MTEAPEDRQPVIATYAKVNGVRMSEVTEHLGVTLRPVCDDCSWLIW